jgi:two-component system sensor histidine kinase MtrB
VTSIPVRHLRPLRIAIREAAGRWRRSLQVRVVVMTLALSGAVVLLLGVVLLRQVAHGLLDAKTGSALGELDFGLAKAASQFDAADRTDAAAVDSTVDAVVNDLANRGSPTQLYDVALLSSAPGASGRVTGGLDEASLPQALRQAVTSQNREAWSFTRVAYRDGRRQSALVVGAPVASIDGSYQLYYVFPLRQEQQTLSLVQRTVLFAGVALVLLLAGIAALVARQVVRPVRVAAATAERLAAGWLAERMTVRGEDDLARLATSFNRMAENLQAQIQALEELSRVQRRFVADVSHELRTPLTTVRMAADVLHEARGGYPPEVARSAELLQTELGRFEALLADLLEISRHDAGAAVLDAELVDLRTLLTRVVERAEPLAARRGCALVVDLPDTPTVAEVDPRRIERVLRNLVGNAVEHGEGRPVEVTLAGGPTAVAVTIRDHGVGLRPGESSLVFSRFWRADPARARTTGGTGLGLSIALEDARLHGGWLQAWGDPREGAVFRLTLPRRVGGPLAESPLPLEPAPTLTTPAQSEAPPVEAHSAPRVSPADLSLRATERADG